LGRKHFAQLCSLLSDVGAGKSVLLDFSGVEMVTGSWINEALVPLIEWATNQRNDVFPVIVNFDQQWHDELQMVAEWNHNCFLVAKGNRFPHTAQLVGKLDVAQRETLDAVTKAGTVTGAELERQHDGVRATAWNNRLKDLYHKRLLQRVKRGREQVYSPVVAEVTIDG
jgi:hypothetical protein